MIDLNAVVRKAHDLEALPVSVTRLASLVVRDDTNTQQIVEVVNYDQALTARLLRAANSAAYAGMGPASTVSEAVLRLGMGAVLALSVGTSIRFQMAHKISDFKSNEVDYWKHSVTTYLVTETLQSYCDTRIPPIASTTALLHDIGKLVLTRFLSPSIVSSIKQQVLKDNLASFEAEMKFLKVHHGHVGALIARHWQLPNDIARGILYHHTPEVAQDLVCYVVAFANEISHHLENKNSNKSKKTETGFNSSLLAYAQFLGISEDLLPEICNHTEQQLDGILHRFL